MLVAIQLYSVCNRSPDSHNQPTAGLHIFHGGNLYGEL